MIACLSISFGSSAKTSKDIGLVLLALYLIRYPFTKFSIDKNPADGAGAKSEAGEVK